MWELSPQLHHLTTIKTQARCLSLRSQDISDLLLPDNHASNKPFIFSWCVASSVLTFKLNMGGAGGTLYLCRVEINYCSYHSGTPGLHSHMTTAGGAEELGSPAGQSPPLPTALFPASCTHLLYLRGPCEWVVCGPKSKRNLPGGRCAAGLWLPFSFSQRGSPSLCPGSKMARPSPAPDHL